MMADDSQNDRNKQFVRLLRQHDKRLSAYVFSLVPNWSDAEDIVQETCARLWEQFDDYRPDADFGAWACTIAHYRVLAYRERTGRDRLQFNENVVQLVGEQVAAVSDDQQNERMTLLAKCMQKISDKGRTILRRFYLEEEKIDQIAADNHCSANAVRLSLSRTRRSLRECVQLHLKDEEQS